MDNWRDRNLAYMAFVAWWIYPVLGTYALVKNGMYCDGAYTILAVVVVTGVFLFWSMWRGRK